MNLPIIGWKKLLKFLGPLLFVFFVIRVVDPNKTLDLLKNIDPILVLLSMIFFPLLMYLRSLRWWMISQQIDLEIPLNRLFQINYIAWFLGNLPLGGISAVSKFFYLKDEGITASRAFFSLTLDKLFDIGGTVVLGFYALYYFPTNLVAAKIPWIFIITTALFIIIGLASGKKIWLGSKQLLRRYLNKKLQQIGSNLENDLKLFWSTSGLSFFVKIMALSVGLGILRSLVMYIIAHAIGLSVSLAFMIACTGLIGLATIIPISISGLGIREAVLLLTLPLMGHSREAALALGFAVFLWTILFKFSGIYFWIKSPLPLKGIDAIKRRFFT
ncbi:hypothetical protein D1BOALGB6SA_9994 [Olavius sp. associated proteobacterium Delta 1]|nr:hypothetical protein D1BOALGB6SA_9994 [Olavius sp. associated proteobacterium Delta 1]